MKKTTFLLLICIAISTWSFAQCTSTAGGNYGNLTMANDGTAEQIAADNWPNAEFSVIEGLIVGNTYTVTGTNTSSIYITVSETTAAIDAIGTTITHGASSVSFTATTAQILIFWNLDATCATQASDATVTTIQCTSASCSCTATSAPDTATATYPVNNAVDVPIDVSGDTPSIDGFAWTDNGEATSYNLNFIGIGTATGVNNPSGINSSWEYSTTYTWSVTSTNCLGTVTSAEYSFTTEADPALSAASFEATTFSLYPNPAKSSISIKSKSQLTSIEIFNQLGQRVMQVEADSMIENTININDLKSGIYFMKILAGNQEKTMKFIKE